MDMIDKQMRSLVQEYRNNVINGNIDTINPEEIERIKKLDDYIGKTPNIKLFFQQKGEVEIIERVSENGSLKIETTYVLCDSVVVDSYQTYPKHL
jgi:hypothetical protein